MRGLQTSRVVVIDDDAQEAIPIIQALGRLGIGCTYIAGDQMEYLPKPPLTTWYRWHRKTNRRTHRKCLCSHHRERERADICSFMDKAPEYS
jgi:hypothetical protein